MADRENSPAYAALPRSARRVLAAIETAIGDGNSASVSYVDFRLDHHISRKAVSPSLKLLDHLGLVEIEPGPRCGNVFRFSTRWRTIDEVEGGTGARSAAASTLRQAAGAEAGEATEATEARDDRAPARRAAAAGADAADAAVAGRRAVIGGYVVQSRTAQFGAHDPMWLARAVPSGQGSAER